MNLSCCFAFYSVVKCPFTHLKNPCFDFAYFYFEDVLVPGFEDVLGFEDIFVLVFDDVLGVSLEDILVLDSEDTLDVNPDDIFVPDSENTLDSSRDEIFDFGLGDNLFLILDYILGLSLENNFDSDLGDISDPGFEGIYGLDVLVQRDSRPCDVHKSLGLDS